MIPVFLKTLCELSIVAIPMYIVAAVAQWQIGATLASGPGWSIIAGIVTGAVHGVGTRSRRNDLFWAHRPVSAVRMHTAEALAAVLVCFVFAFILVAVGQWVATDPVMVVKYGRVVRADMPLPWSEFLVLGVVATAAWSVVWLGLGSRSAILGIATVVVVGVAVYDLGTHARTTAMAATTLALAAIVIAGVRITRLARGRV